MSDDRARQRLFGVKHIVVVMMENRSFDHMLGYLTQEGMTEVDGLKGDEFNFGPDGTKVPVTPFDADANDIQRPGEALQKKLDPDHSKAGVQIQLGRGYKQGKVPNGGFVKAFLESRKAGDDIGRDLWVVPMGYYTAKDVPIYDHLARNYCVCDAWHSSVPGDTWPNRLFALAGHEAAKHPPALLERLLGALGGAAAPAAKALRGAPIYDVRAFTHQLADHQWRWYSHDPATLRAADGQYRRFNDIKRDNFAFFDRKQLSVLTTLSEAAIVTGDSFLDDAANGTLRDVSWIDPNFIDLSVLETSSNDDHPPSDIRAGQAFILDVYDALRNSPAWEDTLLVVVYDEHGGFYDHVAPPAISGDPGHKTLGLRVPALVAGPRVANAVCHEQFDHTSLINTILARFAKHPAKAIANMPARVATARHLGTVLQDDPRTDIPAPDAARETIDRWRIANRVRHKPRAASVPAAAADGAGQPFVLHDFQDEFARFALAMRQAGLPPGQP
jgi:phospholipase C